MPNTIGHEDIGGVAALAFNPKNGQIYSQNHNHQLLVFTPKGDKHKEYELGGGMGVRQILVHPDGKKILVLTDEKLMLVTLPKE